MSCGWLFAFLVFESVGTGLMTPACWHWGARARRVGRRKGAPLL